MVPRYDDKHILEHAETKAAEVRAKNLPIVADDFRISVQDDSLFAPQKAALMNGAFSKLPLTIPEVAGTEVSVWTASHNELIATLEEKLRKLRKTPRVHEQLKARMVKHFLEGENAMQFLHANYPQVEEKRLALQGRERTCTPDGVDVEFGDTGSPPSRDTR